MQHFINFHNSPCKTCLVTSPSTDEEKMPTELESLAPGYTVEVADKLESNCIPKMPLLPLDSHVSIMSYPSVKNSSWWIYESRDMLFWLMQCIPFLSFFLSFFFLELGSREIWTTFPRGPSLNCILLLCFREKPQ